MPNRTRREDVVFQRPFLLKELAEPHPAGTNAVETGEELIEGLSSPAYRRVSTTLTRRPTRAGALSRRFTSTRRSWRRRGPPTAPERRGGRAPRVTRYKEWRT